MKSRILKAHPMKISLRLIAVFSLVFTTMLGAASPALAQAVETTMSIGAPSGSHVWVTLPDGTWLDSCTTSDGGGAHAPGCSVTIPHPTTLVVYVDESTLPPGSIVQENPIWFDTNSLHGRDSWGGGPVFQVIQGNSSSSTGSSNIAVVTTENGQFFLDACFVLVDYSQVGCDVNRDGKITFEAIPYGTYTLRQTSNLAGGRYVNDTTITVTGAADSDGWERFYVSVAGGGSSGSSGVYDPDLPIDISLITRDPDTGGLLTDVCYVLVGYSNIGCDENNDGQVTFAQIPPGTYTVRQTQIPAGYPAINDFEINVMPLGELPGGEIWQIPLGFVVRQAPEQNAPGTLNVSILFIDYATGKKVDTGICVQMVGASNVGCDSDLKDGQVDFLDVPEGGPYSLEFSNLPPGMTPGVGLDSEQVVYIQPDTYPHSIVFGFILLGGPGGTVGGNTNSTSGTSDVAVVTSQNGQYFLDACYVVVDYSQVGCDVNRDGKITFEDIPYGTYTLRQTQSLGGGRYVNDTTITVTGAADTDGWERFYVTVQGGSSSSDLPDEMALLSPTHGQRSLRRQRRIA